MSITASYATRRTGVSTDSGFVRNYNAGRRESGVRLGPVSFSVVVALLVLVVGLIYISGGARATSYDYEIERADKAIAELAAEKESLAIENARAKARAASEENEVASTMANATIAGYVEE